MRTIQLVIISLFTSISVFAQSTLPIKTGNYEETVDLSYDKGKGIISGVIARSNHDNPNGPRISCSMRFVSLPQVKTAGANKYPVRFYNEGDTAEVGKGYLEVTKNGITIKYNGVFTSCQNIMPLDEETGLGFEFSSARAFISASVIGSAKAPIYKTAVDSTKSKMYLVKGNFVSVASITDSWVSFEYMTLSGKRIKGWLKKEDVAL
ncbi:MAG TPA: hypothetical protein VIM79_14370 [Niastella sp.]